LQIAACGACATAHLQIAAFMLIALLYGRGEAIGRSSLPAVWLHNREPM
jgi:hypothetical protein